METERSGNDPFDDARTGDDRLARLLWDHVNRLNSGEKLDAGRIREEHPDVADELIAELETFQAFGSAVEPSPPLGTLGDYTLRREIGRGGMGVVYEAWENSMDRAVALKVLPAGIAADERALQRFVREAKVAGDLHHPNVVPVYGMGLKAKTPYYAMEYIEGQTLAEVLARVKDAPREQETAFGVARDDVVFFSTLARSFADVADGLQHAHSRGVVHRDIKPSNLILDAEGRLRILDFGLARLEGQDSLTISGDFVGTPLYMSPEQARRRKVSVDHRTDVYSLGATLYETLTERPPFRGKDHQDTLSQIIERDPVDPRKLNPRVPGDLETITLKCLRKEPVDRYGTAEALAQDLRRFVRGDPIEARRLGRLVTLARQARRRKGTLTVAGVLVLLVFASGWFAWRSWSEARQRRQAELDRRQTELEATYPDRVLDAADVIRVAELASRFSAGEATGFESAEAYEPFFSATDMTALGRERLPDKVVAAVEDLALATREVPARPAAPYYRARGLLVLGEEDAAHGALSRALERDPAFAPALVLRAELSGAQDDRLVDDLPPGGWGRLWLEAHRALREERWKEAIEALDDLIGSLSQGGEPYVGAEIEFHLQRGLAQQEIGRFHAAIRDYTLAGRRARLLEPALRLAQTYYRRNQGSDREEAERVFHDLHARGSSKGERSDIALWIASAYRSLRDEEKGLEWAKKVEPDALRLRLETIFYIHQGKFSKAAEAASEAVRLDHGNARAHNLCTLAIFHHTMHRGSPESERWWDALIDSAERAWQLDPAGSLTSRMLHGEVLLRRGKIDEARKLSREILERAPRSPIGHILASRVCTEEKRYDAATEAAQIAVKLAPEFSIAHLMYGYALVDQGRVREALESYERALELEPGFLWGWTAKAMALGELGKFDAALRAFEHSFEIQPYNSVRRFYYGRVLEEVGDFPAAIRAYATAFVQGHNASKVYERLLPLLRNPKGTLPERELGEVLEVIESQVDSPQDDPRRLETLALLRLVLPGKTDLALALKYARAAVQVSCRDPECAATLERIEREFARKPGERPPDRGTAPSSGLKRLEKATGQEDPDAPR